MNQSSKRTQTAGSASITPGAVTRRGFPAVADHRIESPVASENFSKWAAPGPAETIADAGSIRNGFVRSICVAAVIGVAGGAFEALFLVRFFEFVTFTMGPNLVFLVFNTVLVLNESREQTRIGLMMGYSGVLVSAAVSFGVFVLIVLQFLF